MDWGRNYTANWRLYKVNVQTWADAGLVGNVLSFRIERDSTNHLLESGTIEVDSTVGGEFGEGYYRIALVAKQDGLTERFDVATLHCTLIKGTVERGRDKLTLAGRSVLYPAYTQRMTLGYYSPYGCDGVALAASLLSGCLHAEVNAEGSFELGKRYVFDLGSRVLDAAWTLLDAGGWCIQITGRGEVRLMEKPKEPSLTLDTAHARLLMSGITHDLDFSNVPNRYMAVDGSEQAIAVNDDENSPTSTVARGFVVDASVDTRPVRINGETLTSYCNRKLQEASTVKDKRTYTREYYPGVLPFSVVRGSMPSVALDGDMRVLRQSIDCSNGVKVTEDAAKEVQTWPMI